MKSLPLLALCITCSLGSLLAQPGCPDAEQQFAAERIVAQAGEPAEALERYRDAFRLGRKSPASVLQAIQQATQNGRVDMAVAFMDHGLRIGLTPGDYARLWPIAGSGFDLDSLLGAIDTTASIGAYKAGLDTALIRKIGLLAERDQAFRREESDAPGRQRTNDSLNWADLKAIVRGLGRLPDYTELGLEGSDNLNILFYHMDLDALSWFVPHVLDAIARRESTLGHAILYQLDRIGMDDGSIYTIGAGGRVVLLGDRHRMKNGMWCQTFGEWLDEPLPPDGQPYVVPLDPSLPLAEVDRVRKLFCLDAIGSKWLRSPWLRVVSLSEFETLFAR
jgi:hypothetical protein